VLVVALQPQPVNAIVRASESAALRISFLTLNDMKEAHLMPLKRLSFDDVGRPDTVIDPADVTLHSIGWVLPRPVV
jgi:hypothetical protein